MVAEKARLTLDLPPELHTRLKVVSARRGTTMREYCVDAIEHKLSDEAPEYITAAEDPVLAALWDNEDDAVYDQL